ncbi:Uncharacterised protein [uncultured archaeon]|nr:Uncharacterised protein [uncultured archaeon]
MMKIPERLAKQLREDYEDCKKLKRNKDLTEFGEGMFYFLKEFFKYCKS